MYGLGSETTRAFGTNCLLARRMVERGVRFVMVTHSSWDQHSELNKELRKNCDTTCAPIAALIVDLERRGLLDSTLVVWGGEFGRTPLGEWRRDGEPDFVGRDHHPNCFTMWMAGGGVRAGTTIGRTDDMALSIVEDPVHVNDLQATILHCLGLDHTRLTHRHQGRDFRLTDVHGAVVRKALA
jgi:arylsulfatase A-like enzyme